MLVCNLLLDQSLIKAGEMYRDERRFFDLRAFYG